MKRKQNEHKIFQSNAAQKRAIEFPVDRPLKVIAGAGTGKTEVLTRRFVHLVRRYKFQPQKILALTFTKKAAAEMQHRIVQSLITESLIDKGEAALLHWIGNFHSISLKLLKQNPLSVGLDPSFEIIDEIEQRILFNAVVDDFLDKRLPESMSCSFEELLVDDPESFADDLFAVISRIKSHFIGPEELRGRLSENLGNGYKSVSEILTETIDNEDLHKNTRRAAENRLGALEHELPVEKLLIQAVFSIYRAYQGRLSNRNLLDFNDLVFHAYKLAKADPELKNKFEYILVDEFQDTDRGQYLLLEALSHGLQNVTVVGDKKQLIYEWREAWLQNIETFPGETIPLEENYRSFGQILKASNEFIGRIMREEPALVPALMGGRGHAANPPVELIRAANREVEASFVAREIRRLIDQGHSPGEIVILSRTVLFSRLLEDALNREGVMYSAVGGCGFYDMQETKDISALLRVVCNPFDDANMVRVLQSEVIGLNDFSLHGICASRKGEVASIYEAIRGNGCCEIDSALAAKAKMLIQAVEELARIKWKLSLGEIFSEALKRVNYLKYLSSQEGLRGPRFSHVAFFYKMASQFEERHPRAGLEEFLEYLETSGAGALRSAPGDSASDKVQIMTIHQAKGLEFPIVFLAGVAPAVFPTYSRGGNIGYEQQFGIFAKKRSGKPFVRYELQIEKYLREKHFLEENRLMYVAMTRAKNCLYVTTHASDKENEQDFFQALEIFSKGNFSDVVSRTVEGTESLAEPKGHATIEKRTDKGVSFSEIMDATAAAIERLNVLDAIPKPAAASPILAYSKLALFRRCPKRFALQHLYKLSFLSEMEVEHDEVALDAGGRVLGNLLHQTLMYYHRLQKENKNPDALLIFEHLARREQCSRKIIESGRDMLRKYLKTDLSRITTLYEEKVFRWNITDGDFEFRVTGIIDRVHRQGEKLKIVDYKSGSVDDAHAFQLALYRMALENAMNERGILTSIFSLSSGKEAEYTFSDKQLEKVREEIIDCARRISRGDFPPCDNTQSSTECRKCEFSGFCS
jgi:DNA helicase-2/ATP-dependent DNA helicase PcrA